MQAMFFFDNFFVVSNHIEKYERSDFESVFSL